MLLLFFYLSCKDLFVQTETTIVLYGGLRTKESDIIKDYCMTRLTFGVSALCFAAKMSVKQNFIGYMSEFPVAAKMATESFYVDDDFSRSR